MRICNGVAAMINCVEYYLPYHVINIHKIVNCLNSCRPPPRAGRRHTGAGAGRCYEVCDLPPVTLAGGWREEWGRGAVADVFLGRHMSPGHGRGWVMGRAVNDPSRSCYVPGRAPTSPCCYFKNVLRHYEETEQAFNHDKSM